MTTELADLSGRTVLVAGASSGMGAATAALAARCGAGLILLARDADRLDETARTCRAQGAGAVRQVLLDAAAPDAAGALATDLADAGRIDVLVNCIGMNIMRRAFAELADADWQQMLRVNLDAAYNLTRAVLPGMRAAGGGLVIHVSSTAAVRPDPSGAAYQASKAAVRAMSHAIMEEEWPNGIRMTTVMPGMTDTPLLDRRPTPVPAEKRAAALQPEDVARTCVYVMGLPARAHVAEILLQPAIR
ncbi:SDR family NAD(P)-dependent oxidoreductase [Rhodobacteraceae bacterium 2CG4]|uniref:SDR family NAD(P)-dependent oxidoreductase n=1 Tax=Halovulum marinum TaxID=2662447 RepID=A0A6L5YXQ7_9RHOB|nr:SDR family NAD(P)-dependent oxidoreductase [Halovulum marinum]MSU89111.1 SDR family NAD(P)-dependent oxidoreductase [Halovulum marinum]